MVQLAELQALAYIAQIIGVVGILTRTHYIHCR